MTPRTTDQRRDNLARVAPCPWVLSALFCGLLLATTACGTDTGGGGSADTAGNDEAGTIDVQADSGAAASDTFAADATSDSAVADATLDSAVADATSDSAVVDATSDSAVADATPDSAVADATLDSAVVDATSDSAAPDSASDAAPTGNCSAPQPEGTVCEGSNWVCAPGYFKSWGETTCHEATCQNMSEALNAIKINVGGAAQACTYDEDCTAIDVSTACQGACPMAVNSGMANDVLKALGWFNDNVCVPLEYAKQCGYSTPKCLAPKVGCDAGVCVYSKQP